MLQTGRPPILTVDLPPASALAKPERPYDYSDSYAASLPHPSMTASDAAWAFFGRAPAWISTLMRIRNGLVSLVGLKTGNMDAKKPARTELKAGDKVGMFRIYAVSDREVILGEDDRHLNFRVSVFLEEPGREPRRLIVSTVVHFHNALGRTYFFFVGPFHRRIVPAMFRRMLTHT